MKLRPVRDGVWVNYPCPYCCSTKEHYGIRVKDGRICGAKCFKCGVTRINKELAAQVAELEGIATVRGDASVDTYADVTKPARRHPLSEVILNAARLRWPGALRLEDYVTFSDEMPFSLFFKGRNDQGQCLQERRILADHGPKCLTYGATGPVFFDSTTYISAPNTALFCEGMPSLVAAHARLFKIGGTVMISLQGCSNTALEGSIREAALASGQVILALDNDAAGKHATLRLGSRLLELVTVPIYVALMPEGHDPADDTGELPLKRIENLSQLVEHCLA